MYKSSTSSQPRVFAMWAVCFIQKFKLPLKSKLKENLFTQIPHSVNAPTVSGHSIDDREKIKITQ